jgi:hypothetical protein
LELEEEKWKLFLETTLGSLQPVSASSRSSEGSWQGTWALPPAGFASILGQLFNLLVPQFLQVLNDDKNIYVSGRWVWRLNKAINVEGIQERKAHYY